MSEIETGPSMLLVIDPSSMSQHKRTASWCISYQNDRDVVQDVVRQSHRSMMIPPSPSLLSCPLTSVFHSSMGPPDPFVYVECSVEGEIVMKFNLVHVDFVQIMRWVKMMTV